MENPKILWAGSTCAEIENNNNQNNFLQKRIKSIFKASTLYSAAWTLHPASLEWDQCASLPSLPLSLVTFHCSLNCSLNLCCCFRWQQVHLFGNHPVNLFRSPVHIAQLSLAGCQSPLSWQSSCGQLWDQPKANQFSSIGNQLPGCSPASTDSCHDRSH